MRLPRSLIFGACALGVAVGVGPTRTSAAEPVTAIVTAYEPEWQALLPHIDKKEDVFAGGVHFVRGRAADTPVVVIESNYGPVNAAAATQLAIDRFQVSRILVAGISGAVDASLRIGDVVIPDQWADFLFSVLARKTGAGKNGAEFSLPPYPFIVNKSEHYHMVFPQPVPIGHAPDAPELTQWMHADAGLLNIVQSLPGNVALSRCSAKGKCLKQTPGLVLGGNGVSGSAFVDNADFRGFLDKSFHARAVDMESAAVAHVAAANKIPFIAFRSVSDLAGGSADANEIMAFQDLAAENGTTVLLAFLEWSSAKPNWKR